MKNQWVPGTPVRYGTVSTGTLGTYLGTLLMWLGVWQELLTAEEAYSRARATGSDIFQGGEPPNRAYSLDYEVGRF